MLKIRKVLLSMVLMFGIVFALTGCLKPKPVEVDPVVEDTFTVTVEGDGLVSSMQGTEATLTITVPEGKVFDKLVVDGVEVTPVDNVYTFTVTKNVTAVVTYTDVKVDPEEPVVNDTVNLFIYEVYGGGGNADAPYNNDYIVLYNLTDKDIDLGEYTVQYASADAGKYFSITKLEGVIKAETFFVIQFAAGKGVTEVLPVVDFVAGTVIGKDYILGLAATNGKVALVFGEEPITGPDNVSVVDYVAFGTGTPALGDAAAPAPSNTTSIKRTSFVNTNQNSVDFVAGLIDLDYLLPIK